MLPGSLRFAAYRIGIAVAETAVPSDVRDASVSSFIVSSVAVPAIEAVVSRPERRHGESVLEEYCHHEAG